jgi:hypothetical protein
MGQSETDKIKGIHAGPVRLTPLGAALVALAVAVPGGLAIWFGQAVWLLVR